MVHKSLIQGFKDIAGSIHQVLHKEYYQTPITYDDDSDDEESADKPPGMFCTKGTPVREHGVLMECTIPSEVPFNNAPKLLYWVTG